MSHFFTVVIVDPDVKDVEQEVAKLLAPYDENLEVKPYSEKCSCIGFKARLEAREKAAERFGPFEDLRESFKEKVRSMLEESGLSRPSSDASQEEWDVVPREVLRGRQGGGLGGSRRPLG